MVNYKEGRNKENVKIDIDDLDSLSESEYIYKTYSIKCKKYNDDCIV